MAAAGARQAGCATRCGRGHCRAAVCIRAAGDAPPRPSTSRCARSSARLASGDNSSCTPPPRGLPAVAVAGPAGVRPAHRHAAAHPRPVVHGAGRRRAARTRQARCGRVEERRLSSLPRHEAGLACPSPSVAAGRTRERRDVVITADAARAALMSSIAASDARRSPTRGAGGSHAASVSAGGASPGGRLRRNLMILVALRSRRRSRRCCTRRAPRPRALWPSALRTKSVACGTAPARCAAARYLCSRRTISFWCRSAFRLAASDTDSAGSTR